MFLGRAVAPGEALWLNEDREWAMALAEVEADRCPDCKEPWSESSDPANEFAYRADLLRCHTCATAARTAHAHQESGGDTRGIHVAITKQR
ncbi:hypothetical protein [Streptomyces liangshanensis]|uniref:hypothetical protein n=1 Tax=Streptomyces liangshanensis TaxID=2717324 RepID=UPI0036DCA7EE